MRTESGARFGGPHAHRYVLATLVAFVVMSTLLPLAFAQTRAEPPWRDYPEASSQLAEAQVRLLDARDDLVAAERLLVDLGELHVAKNQETFVVASELQASQELARDLAVEAYMSGGTLPDAVYVLDSATANEFAYRTTILAESSDAVLRSSVDYAEQRSRASQAALNLAAEIDGMDRTIELAAREIPLAEAALVQAEWVVSIAEIHAAAEELLDRFGRTDPTPDQWAELRFCEATGDYSLSTGNGFYGAYQFTLTTWGDMGGSGLPSDATPEEQDARARYLYALRGSGYGIEGSWPNCGRHLPRN